MGGCFVNCFDENLIVRDVCVQLFLDAFEKNLSNVHYKYVVRKIANFESLICH